ncbi:MAG TPA: hypothetical protein EYP10_05640, partial [Armatimonadetes bacterium]|nr:hypothetical protein [Armatimonadota bacterium]
SQSETQRKIVDILKMDYETFIASAFILQGRADEFTRKAPGERKEVLSEILGLEHYQQLAELAREHQRQCAESVRALEREVAQIDEEIGHRSEYEGRERVLKSQYDELQRRLDTMAESVEKLRERIAQLQQARQRVAELNEQITAVQRELDALRRQASQDERRVEQLQKLLAKRLDIERNYREYQTALALNAELTEKLQTLNQLQGQRQRLERAIEHARNQLERQLARLHEQRKALEQVVEEAQKVLAQRESIERGYRELESLRLEEERWEEKRKRWDELREREQQLERELQRERSSLEAQLQALCHRARELKVRASQEKRWQEACAKLTSELARLQALERERDELQQSIVQCERALAELAKEHATLQNTVEDANAKLKLLAEAKEPQCPLCESPLDDDHKRLLSNKLMHQLQSASEQMEALKAKR